MVGDHGRRHHHRRRRHHHHHHHHRYHHSRPCTFRSARHPKPARARPPQHILASSQCVDRDLESLWCVVFVLFSFVYRARVQVRRNRPWISPPPPELDVGAGLYSDARRRRQRQRQHSITACRRACPAMGAAVVPIIVVVVPIIIAIPLPLPLPLPSPPWTPIASPLCRLPRPKQRRRRAASVLGRCPEERPCAQSRHDAGPACAVACGNLHSTAGHRSRRLRRGLQQSIIPGIRRRARR